MPRVPPNNLALKGLRAVLDWPSRRLADAVGICPSFMSRLEHGKPALTRERLEEFATAMGASCEAVAASLAFVWAVLPAELDEGPGSLTAGDRRFVEEAVASGALVHRRVLTQGARRYRLTKEREAAVALWARLEREKLKDQRFLFEQAPELRTGALVAHLCDESERKASHRADVAIELAELAAWLAERARGGEAFRARALGYASAFVGNALRVANRYEASRAAHDRAKDLFAQGHDELDVFSPLRLLDLEASLHKDQREFPQALALLGRALALASDNDRPRLLLKRASTFEQKGDYASAISDLREACPAIEAQGNARLRLVWRFNLATNLLHLDNPLAARELLPEVHLLANQLAFDLDQVRVRWLEGRLAAGEHRWVEAISTYESVAEEFTQMALGADAAVVWLDAAALHLELGNVRKVRSLASTVRVVLGAHGVEREELAAVRLFLDAANRDLATAALAREAARAIEFGGPALARELRDGAARGGTCR